MVDIYAPFDDEVNPATVGQDTIPEESHAVEEQRVVKVIPQGNSKPEENKDNKQPSLVKVIPQGNPKRKRSHWDSVCSGANMKNDEPKSPPRCMRPLNHWREINGVGVAGTHHGDDLGRTLVQKILFADACCGTSTPNSILNLFLKL